MFGGTQGADAASYRFTVGVIQTDLTGQVFVKTLLCTPWVRSNIRREVGKNSPLRAERRHRPSSCRRAVFGLLGPGLILVRQPPLSDPKRNRRWDTSTTSSSCTPCSSPEPSGTASAPAATPESSAQPQGRATTPRWPSSSSYKSFSLGIFVFVFRRGSTTAVLRLGLRGWKRGGGEGGGAQVILEV